MPDAQRCPKTARSPKRAVWMRCNIKTVADIDPVPTGAPEPRTPPFRSSDSHERCVHMLAKSRLHHRIRFQVIECETGACRKRIDASVGYIMEIHLVDVLFDRFTRIDLILYPVEPGCQYGCERKIRVAGGSGDLSLILVPLPCIV